MSPNPLSLPAVVILLFCAANAGSAPSSATTATVTFLDLETQVPDHWRRSEPGSSMRLAQFDIAPRGGPGVAEVILYYFGAGQGGSPEANITRWQAQFRGPDGQAPQPEIQRFRVSELPVTRVKLQGSYARGIGAGPGGQGKPEQTLIAALVATPRGQVIIQLHGDTDVVSGLEAEFDRMLYAIRPERPSH